MLGYAGIYMVLAPLSDDTWQYRWLLRLTREKNWIIGLSLFHLERREQKEKKVYKV